MGGEVKTGQIQQKTVLLSDIVSIAKLFHKSKEMICIPEVFAIEKMFVCDVL